MAESSGPDLAAAPLRGGGGPSPALLGLGLLLAFGPALLGMARVWATQSYYAHGFLVPLFSLAALGAERGRLGPVARDARGYAALALALALYLGGLVLELLSVQGLALVAAAAGWVFYAWGPRGLRRLAFPVGFLVFMVPLPGAVVTPLIVGLQLAVSALAVEVLHAIGLEVVREGNVLVLAHARLFVAEACSGITSLITLTPLGVLLAYFTERGWGRRLLLVAAVLPLAVAGNLLRLVGTALAADTWGAERVTSSTLHELAGLLTFALSCVGLLAVGALMRRAGPREARTG